ncbi:hypothetical protein MTO96_039586 [Rhipicephalus appendiculatus]
MLPPAHQPSNPNLAGSTTSHQQPQQSWNGIFPPVSPQIQGSGSGPQFLQQYGQQPWNGPGTSQQSSLNQSNPGITQNFTPHQHGTGTLSVSDQRPGEQPWRGHAGSRIPQQNEQQWSNGVQLPNSSPRPLQQAGSGGISTSPQPQWGNPAGVSYIHQPGQQQQWGSGNVSQNLQQYRSAEVTPSNPQLGQSLSWRSGVSAGGQLQSTVAQQGSGAARMIQNPSPQQPWSGQAATVSSQGLQQGQYHSWRGGISPSSQQNAAARRNDGSGLPIQNQPTQPALNGQLPSQPWNTGVTSTGSQQNAQQQQNNWLLSQFLTSYPTANPKSSIQPVDTSPSGVH